MPDITMFWLLMATPFCISLMVELVPLLLTDRVMPFTVWVRLEMLPSAFDTLVVRLLAV